MMSGGAPGTAMGPAQFVSGDPVSADREPAACRYGDGRLLCFCRIVEWLIRGRGGFRTFALRGSIVGGGRTHGRTGHEKRASKQITGIGFLFRRGRRPSI
jgi:hypothetical protein